MGVKSRKSVERMIKELDEEYSNLLESIKGKPYKGPTGQQDNESVEIDSRGLRLAIDKMSAVLKEAKLLGK